MDKRLLELKIELLKAEIDLKKAEIYEKEGKLKLSKVSPAFIPRINVMKCELKIQEFELSKLIGEEFDQKIREESPPVNIDDFDSEFSS